MLRGLRGRGFTFVELLVAIAIIATLATLVVISLGRAQLTARDSRRKTDVRAYVAGIEKYRLTNVSGFTAGVGGNFYGRINFAGPSTQGGLAYTSGTTIGAELAKAGIVSGVVYDPSATQSDTVVDQRDYVLIRCNNANIQETDAAVLEKSFSVWAKLESAPTEIDSSNAARLCGGSKVTPSGNTFEFGYGSSTSPSLIKQPVSGNDEADLHYFGVGNAQLPLP